LTVDDKAALDLVARVETLLDEVEGLPQRDKALEVVEALVQLYGEGLARIAAAADGDLARFADDELVAHLLLLHDLHPVPAEERVRRAVADVGGDSELIAIDDGVVLLRPRAGGCAVGSTAATKRQAIEAAIERAAPDVDRVEFVDMPEPVLVLPQVQVQRPGATPA
jgi:Fe-S cluster biogenesis protein NfuA